MNKRTKMIAGAGVIALGALVAVTPRFLFPVCEYHGILMQLPNGKTDHMHCYYTAMASYVIGPLICLIGLTLLLAKARETFRLLSVVLGGAAAIAFLVPMVFPVCQNPDHPCNHGAKPMIIVLGITTLMMAAWLAFSARRSAAAYSVSMSDAT